MQNTDGESRNISYGVAGRHGRRYWLGLSLGGGVWLCRSAQGRYDIRRNASRVAICRGDVWVMGCDLKMWRLALLLAAGAVCWPVAAGAVQSDPVGSEAAEPTGGLPQATAGPTVLKTLSFLSLASVNDFGFGYLYGGLAVGGAMVAANLTTGWGLYYLHESGWAAASQVGPLPDDTTALRTASFTVVNAARIFGLGLLVAGDPIISGGFVVFNAVGDAVAYVVTDQLWLRWPVGTRGSDGVAPTHGR